jgi:hypothetical protein
VNGSGDSKEDKGHDYYSGRTDTTANGTIGHDPSFPGPSDLSQAGADLGDSGPK